MAEGAEDRTEAPSAKRVSQARERGQVAISRDFTSLAVIAAATLTLVMAGPGAARSLAVQLRAFLTTPVGVGAPAVGGGAVADAAGMLLRTLAPFLVVPLAAGIAAVFLQSGLMVSLHTLIPDLARLSPMRGVRRVFSRTNLIEALKSVVKIAVLGAVAWRVLAGRVGTLAAAQTLSPAALLAEISHLLVSLLFGLLAAQAVIALLDIAWTRTSLNRSLRMSREEVKEEQKETDGDPRIKNRVRQIRLARAKRRIAEAMKQATVVVTNPTHYAVALAYDRTRSAAPKVVAKGVDEMAARIRALAEANKVPLVADPPLARALYLVALDADIPPEHYRAVAGIIAYVWRLQGRLAGAAPRAAP